MVERDGKPIEQRDRHGRLKTTEVALVRDPDQPIADVEPRARQFARGAKQRRWSTIVSQYGDGAHNIAVELVRAGEVELVCPVNQRGIVGDPKKWVLTAAALSDAAERRGRSDTQKSELASERMKLAELVRQDHPDVAQALMAASTPAAHAVLAAVAYDLLDGIEHAGRRAFAQNHFGNTKRYDVAAILRAAGVGTATFDQLGLRRGDRIGLGGPIQVTLLNGTVDLAPLRGPVQLRLDQPHMRVSTTSDWLAIIENLQSAEAVCARHPELAVIYTGGQFGDDASAVIAALGEGRRTIAIADADLGGVRIARRIKLAVPHAQLVDVGTWPHAPGDPLTDASRTALAALTDDPSIGDIAAAIHDRGYQVEQEQSTIQILDGIMKSTSRRARSDL